MYRVVESLYCAPETNITLYVNYTSIKKCYWPKKIKFTVIKALLKWWNSKETVVAMYFSRVLDILHQEMNPIYREFEQTLQIKPFRLFNYFWNITIKLLICLWIIFVNVVRTTVFLTDNFSASQGRTEECQVGIKKRDLHTSGFFQLQFVIQFENLFP